MEVRRNFTDRVRLSRSQITMVEEIIAQSGLMVQVEATELGFVAYFGPEISVEDLREMLDLIVEKFKKYRLGPGKSAPRQIELTTSFTTEPIVFEMPKRSTYSRFLSGIVETFGKVKYLKEERAKDLQEIFEENARENVESPPGGGDEVDAEEDE